MRTGINRVIFKLNGIARFMAARFTLAAAPGVINLTGRLLAQLLRCRCAVPRQRSRSASGQ